MDLWVVAAAAGAGLAKHWQNFSREKEGLSELSGDFIGGKSSSEQLLEQLRNKSRPFRKLAPRRIEEEASSSRKEVLPSLDGRVSEMTRLGDSEMASTSGFDDEMLVNYGRLEGYNILSLSSMPPGISALRNNQENGKKIKGSSVVGGESSDRLPELCRGEIGSFHTFRRSGSSLRSKRSRGFSVKPLNSLESCLVAQLYKEHVEMEEYVFSTFPSPSRPTVRPLVVTDGNRVISRASSDFCSVQLESGESKLHKNNGFYSDEREIVLGVPPLPEICPVERKQKRGKGRFGRLSNSKTKVSGRNLPSQGSANGMFLFCLGISIGVMSTVIANKNEVDKLNGLLKQTENLVQDLQEELEMKASLTVKELANEDDESQETNDHSFHNLVPTSFSSELSSLNYDAKRPEIQKAEPEENSEFMSQIEAELEAELERLEMNMHSSSLETRLSGLELDPEFVGNIVQGELRADMVKGGDGFQAESDRDATGTSTTQTENVNYAVSPRELSLRLHEVIQSRLEERIMELESELQSSQKRVNMMESKKMNFRRNFSNSEIGSSSQESLTIEEGNPTARPLFLNLAGDALDAYHEVYEEFMRIPGTDEEEKYTPLTVSNSNQIDKERIHLLDRNLFSSRDGSEENGSFLHVKMIEERDPKLLRDKMRTWERFSSSRGSNEVGEFEEENGDEEDEDGDEMGRLLIKQIVEKTRQGSPVVLNAQRLLFSMDDEL
ncbi:hypothetical protein BVC80_9083g105 [Macleaya cordata]|uniref:Uncharacterized protein n=1 Tax=Macleaya cordata TaxID=56857 RepID=A0A200PRH6_MACCD|nr:hypothetical protein BVC80_9083g105 [Macleaya cordata]